MGKKLCTNQASTKISKDDKKKQQQQLNTMIKILRPKVYITHSSDFKRLVQDLTGNGNNNYSPAVISRLSATPLVAHPPPTIEIIEDEQHHRPQETTSPVFSVDVSSDAGTRKSNNNNTPLEEVAYTMGERTSYNQFNKYTDFSSNNLDILCYDSPSSGADIILPESLNSILQEEWFQINNMENHHDYFPEVQLHSDDLVSLSPQSSTSSDWQQDMMDPFISNNFYDFDDACYHNFNIQKEQSLFHQQEVFFFDNIELLQW